MNEEQITVAALAEPVLFISAGDALRQAREASGLHIAALASILKVPVKKLEALESNRFDLLPDAVFVRALAASICRTLKIDAAPVLVLLPMTTSSRLGFAGRGMNEQFRSPGDAPRASTLAQASRPAVMAGLAFLFGALMLVFLPALKEGFNDLKSTVTGFSSGGTASSEAGKTADAAIQSRSSGEPFASAATVNGGIPQTLSAGVGAAGAQTSVSITASVPALVPDSKGVVAGGAPATSSPTFAVSASPSTATDVVVFVSSGESWVEATDAKGQVVLRRMFSAGEVAGAAGSTPLKIVVGRANVMQVQIRGKTFDLNPVSKDNVARFEVK